MIPAPRPHFASFRVPRFHSTHGPTYTGRLPNIKQAILWTVSSNLDIISELHPPPPKLPKVYAGPTDSLHRSHLVLRGSLRVVIWALFAHGELANRRP